MKESAYKSYDDLPPVPQRKMGSPRKREAFSWGEEAQRNE